MSCSRRSFVRPTITTGSDRSPPGVWLNGLQGACAFLAPVLAVPLAGQQIGIVPIGAGSITAITGFTIVCMAGFELVKMVKRYAGIWIRD